MAFHQPTRQPYQRVVRPEPSERLTPTLAPEVRSGPEESQTWVLFSPTSDATTTASYLSSVQEAQPTPGRSRLSDIGSLDTIARSDANSESWSPPGHAQPTTSAIAAEDDGELDSLDGHLPEFRSVPSPYHSGKGQDTSYAAPVLPGHDGLGSFRLDARGGGGSELQEQIYAFEKYNPRRVKRRREDLDLEDLGLAQLEADQGESQEAERNRRIEAWRLEQGRYLLDRIQRETRQRRMSEASARKLRSEKSAADELASLSAVGERAQPDTHAGGDDWHDQDAAAGSSAAPEGIWSRITRTVIQDLMGIDDRLLSILFGEAFPDDDDNDDGNFSTPRASSPATIPAAAELPDSSSSWQLRVLERVAKELGLLVHRLSNHPGAFSTYMRMQQEPIPYAGLPVIPETPADAAKSETRRPTEESTASMPQFRPTIGSQTQPMAIPQSSVPPPADSTAGDSHGHGPAFTQQEWEKDLDIHLVFRYLRSRFTSDQRPAPSHPLATGSDTSHLATSSTQDVAAKAARVRQHHPLVSRPHAHQRSWPADRRPFKAASPAGPVLRHPPGSCASQSTRRSARRSSISSRQSSRHYWDIGGSVGTGSIVTSAGPMGSWGEV